LAISLHAICQEGYYIREVEHVRTKVPDEQGLESMLTVSGFTVKGDRQIEFS